MSQCVDVKKQSVGDVAREEEVTCTGVIFSESWWNWGASSRLMRVGSASSDCSTCVRVALRPAMAVAKSRWGWEGESARLEVEGVSMSVGD